jgi:2,4-dichlorophenol 6-monooxygenase
MEILRELQVADDVYAQTGPVGGVSFYTSLTGYKLGEIKMADHPDYIERLIASSPSPLTISSQIVLEKILKQHADESEMVDLRFGHEKISLQQAEDDVDADYVDAEIVDLNTGLSSSIRSSYVIACDGAASPTRREFNREMLGAPAFGHQINVYIEADIESLVDTTSHQALYWISTEGVSGVFIGLGGDWKHWCFNFSYFPHKGEKAEDFTEAVCLQKVQAALGTDALPVKILSIGPWVLCGQVIDEYRQGRVFFGGDAAHLNIPTGGFGFNTGMQEIHNLAWKLAYVLRGLAPDELLDSYHDERRDVAVFNVETSRKNAINIRETGAGLGSEVEDADEMETDSPRGERQRKKRTDAIEHQCNHFIFLGQEIGFGYWDSGLITKDGSAHYVEEHGVEDPIYTYIANARPGARAPHCWVTQNGTLLSLLDLYTTEFTLLIHGDVHAWKETLVDLPEDVPINVYSIGDPDSRADLIDIHGVWNQYYGIEKAGAVLIRPDGHVSWRAATKADDHDGSSVKTAIMKSLALH